MPTPIKMPRLGESVAEGTVGAWLKQEGDWVEKDESLAEIVTDKINAELPSPVAGRLAKILVKVDETVAVGVDIALIEENAALSTSSPAEATPVPDAAPVKSPAQAVASVTDDNSATARSDGTVPRKSTQVATPVTEDNNANAANGATAAVYSPGVGEEERQRISPLARRLAREHGIDLKHIAATNGRVRKEDILAYLEQQQTAAPATSSYGRDAYGRDSSRPRGVIETTGSTQQPTAAASTLEFLPALPAGAEEDVELVTPSRLRLAIAEHMVRSKRTSPHATTVVEVDMTTIAKWLEKNKGAFRQREGYGISYVAFVMKAVCEGIRKVPIINSSWTEDNKIVVKKRINLGIAVATEAGLVVPTLYDTDQYTLAGLAKQIAAITQRARTNKLTVQDMQNSTFVVNNPGTFGTIISVPIINQPHAAILSMDAVVKRPVVIEDDAIAVRSMMYLCLSFDHRILDGAGAAGFLQAVRTKLQSYGREIDVY